MYTVADLAWGDYRENVCRFVSFPAIKAAIFPEENQYQTPWQQISDIAMNVFFCFSLFSSLQPQKPSEQEEIC